MYFLFIDHQTSLKNLLNINNYMFIIAYTIILFMSKILYNFLLIVSHRYLMLIFNKFLMY
jgi:hypothetical protein